MICSAQAYGPLLNVKARVLSYVFLLPPPVRTVPIGECVASICVDDGQTQNELMGVNPQVRLLFLSYHHLRGLASLSNTTFFIISRA